MGLPATEEREYEDTLRAFRVMQISLDECP